MPLPSKEFIRQLEKEVDLLHQQIMDHPLFARWFAGTLPVSIMRGYVVQAYLWKDQNEELMPLMIPRSPRDVRSLILKNLASEAGEGTEERHGELLIRFGEEIGVTREEFERGQPIVEVESFMNFMYRIFHEGHFLDMAAALNFACEGLLVKKYPRIAEALRRHYWISARGLRFWEIHIEADAEHAGDGATILEKYATTDQLQARARHLARRALEHRLLAIEGCSKRFS